MNTMNHNYLSTIYSTASSSPRHWRTYIVYGVSDIVKPIAYIYSACYIFHIEWLIVLIYCMVYTVYEILYIVYHVSYTVYRVLRISYGSRVYDVLFIEYCMTCRISYIEYRISNIVWSIYRCFEYRKLYMMP